MLRASPKRRLPPAPWLGEPPVYGVAVLQWHLKQRGHVLPLDRQNAGTQRPQALSELVFGNAQMMARGFQRDLANGDRADL
jgi:hypothetical protein